VSAEDASPPPPHLDWPPNFPKSDEEIDYSDIPPQDWSGPNVVRGKYRDLALAVRASCKLDADVRRAFPRYKRRQSSAAWAHRDRNQCPQVSPDDRRPWETVRICRAHGREAA